MSDVVTHRLAEIRAYEQKASRDGWEVGIHSHPESGCRCLSCSDTVGYFVDNAAAIDCEDRVAKRSVDGEANSFGRELDSCESDPLLSWDDANFAVRARKDLPALLAAVEAVQQIIEKAAKRRDSCNTRIAALYDKYRDEDGEIRSEANHDPAIRYLEGRAGCSAGLEDELAEALATALGEQVSARG